MMHPTTQAILSMVLDRALSAANWGGILGLIQEYEPGLYDELKVLDVDAATALFVNDDGRTISYQIAIRAQNGDVICQALCGALDLLSPDHCVRTLAGS